ncbi:MULTISPECIES: RNA polymerase sigma factor [Streptomyces]|uniref:Sigma-70 region 2 n=1 Tax=Streptomyces turgidiscabies (strain Car8) TaxID=698760 RepID=L7EQA8_STRT8|nr:RNA polymerase sigma factor [Streptomyces reticuliscabiei]ELP61613.1 sigma-70 region 2 [Streptomyces turgidiscabies Car8]GAQ74867.1 RNA polymerase sigma factor [Streptomyces turgidiscabies]
MVEKSVGLSTRALGALYRDQRREMEGLARRLLADERLPDSVMSSEDIVQTAFAKALRTPEQIRDPRAYLYAVIRSDVRAASRQHRRRSALTAAPTVDTQSPDVHVADFSDLVANRVAVHKALCNLPPQQRTAVWATKALEYTQAETAEAMQKKPGTVATHVVRAVTALRIHLAALLVVSIIVLSLAGSRLLRSMQPPAGSPQDQMPQVPSTSPWIYLAVGCLLTLGLARWVFRLWTRRRQAIKEGGTFAPRSIVDRFQGSSLSGRWYNGPARRQMRRTTASDDDLQEVDRPYGVVHTRTLYHN